MRRHFLSMVGILVLALVAVSMWNILKSHGPRPVAGRVAPDFNLISVDNQPVSLSTLRGQPVFLVFLSPYGTASVNEAKLVEQMYQKYGRTMAIFGFMLNSGKGSQKIAHAFVSNQHLKFPVLYGDTSNITTLYKVISVPTGIWINKRGVIEYRMNTVQSAWEQKAQFAGLAKG